MEVNAAAISNPCLTIPDTQGALTMLEIEPHRELHLPRRTRADGPVQS
jgi:hypothetical protein